MQILFSCFRMVWKKEKNCIPILDVRIRQFTCFYDFLAYLPQKWIFSLQPPSDLIALYLHSLFCKRFKILWVTISHAHHLCSLMLWCGQILTGTATGIAIILFPFRVKSKKSPALSSRSSTISFGTKQYMLSWFFCNVLFIVMSPGNHMRYV